MRSISYLACLVLISGIMGCKGSVSRKLIQRAEQACNFTPNNPCIVKITDATNFKWDKLYLFGAWTNSDTISSQTGLKYMGDDVPDDYMRMIFIFQNKVVHEEDFISLDYNSSTINFTTDSNDYFFTGRNFLKPTTASFKVDKSKIDKSCDDCFLYSFIPVKK